MSRTYSSQYSRPSSNGSDSSAPSEGTAMAWIMEHLENYPERFIELPLRTTYILNSNPKLKASDFKMLMLEHIASLPQQPPALPHTFLSSFVKKCFPRNPDHADFDQALTALDYLRNLEDRRKREIGKVMNKAGVDSRDSRVLQLKDRMQKVDNLYARVLTGLRQWTLINELENGDYNRSNCIAMLNTLYPIEEPSVNDYLTHDILSAHRQYLWKCIANFEVSAPTILHSLKQSRGGWASLCDKIHAYLRLCLDMINQCEEICRSLSSSASIVSRSSSFSSDVEIDSISASEKGSTLDKIVWQLGNLKSFRSYRKNSKQGHGEELGRVTSHKSTEGSSLYYD